MTCGSAAAGGTKAPVPSQAYAYEGDLIDFPPPPSGVSVIGSESPNEISVRFESATHYRISDSAAGIVPAGPGVARVPCESVDPNTVRCDHLGLNVGAALAQGDDRLEVRLAVDVGADGGPGRDRIRTGSGADDLRGGGGRDVLRAGAGDDELHGDRGRDAVYADRGDDLLLMANGDRDRVINCGPGLDTAIVDARIDPKPRGCERIKVRPLDR